MTESMMEEKLEAMVDAKGLEWVLAMLAKVAGDKSDHVAINWQDRALSTKWAEAGSKLGQLTGQIARIGLA